MKKFAYCIGLFLVVFYTSAQTTSHSSISKPLVLGVIDELQSKELSEKRTLNIYLPEGYNPKDTLTYPVIYVLDGSIDEDFLHIVGLVHYNSFPWINRVPKSIVVGIANVDRRRDFTTPSSIDSDKKVIPTNGGSARFIAFIEKELQPFVNAKYKTNTSKTIIGQSLAGLLATEILFTKPQLFDKYIIVSPSLWWNNGALLNQSPSILQESFSYPTAVYVGVGKEGLTPTSNHVMEVDANILADKIQQTKSKKVQVYFDYLPNENHATVTHSAVFNAFRILYPDKKQ
ncbi:alpha/beta hydrolase [Flectobacillus major]|jgi:predicted alpha/beta superfamily hydrolase|uniref:alpha/beta hydrolase n=1 Tax=Flectobacillus major TaxID=103 RepID=UPI00047C9B3D|nr:alpha/beta hydrolase-fold protein [Flectobacillus major]